MGHVLATGCGRIPQHETLDKWDLSFLDANGPKKSDDIDEYEGQKTSLRAYVREAIKRQRELKDLCRRNTAQALMPQRKKYDERMLQAKQYAVRQCI